MGNKPIKTLVHPIDGSVYINLDDFMDYLNQLGNLSQETFSRRTARLIDTFLKETIKTQILKLKTNTLSRELRQERGLTPPDPYDPRIGL